MKRLGMMMVGMLAMLAMVLLTGCVTHSVVTTYDKDGKIVTVTDASSDVVDKITKSTGDKSLFVKKSGWAAYLSVSMSTTDDPTPTGKIWAGKVDNIYISLHKDQDKISYDNLAKVIQAMESNLTVTAPGVGTIGETPAASGSLATHTLALPATSGVIGGETGTPYVATPDKATGGK